MTENSTNMFTGLTEECPTVKPERKSKYQIFRIKNNYRKSDIAERRCGSCAHSHRFQHRNKGYWKCGLLGISNSEATDIRKGHVCDSFIGYSE